MIRFDVSKSDLEKLVIKHNSNWLDNSKKRTENIVAEGEYKERSNIWSQIKSVYMGIQFLKCVFCEKRLADLQYGAIAFDVEHFRPKSAVTRWPTEVSETVTYQVGEPNSEAYHWLAYDLQNYAVSCKICNSTLKNAAFPIFGERKVGPIWAHLSVKQLTINEKQALCYPIGKIDVNPESLIEFLGPVARPRSKRGEKKKRGEVIIEMFRLNKRDDLLIERSNKISLLGACLCDIDRGINVSENQEAANNYLADSQTHAACSRDFLKLWFNDKEHAENILNEAKRVSSSNQSLLS